MSVGKWLEMLQVLRQMSSDLLPPLAMEALCWDYIVCSLSGSPPRRISQFHWDHMARRTRAVGGSRQQGLRAALGNARGFEWGKWGGSGAWGRGASGDRQWGSSGGLQAAGTQVTGNGVTPGSARGSGRRQRGGSGQSGGIWVGQ
ncbi:hypothetical protein GUJ93_ZPchr0002g23059 [Zizania palustris]|uniref:Uncharacterized protein n=1 Tax=Zizania palustris TaxID=103762 RepID=A0A8J5V550_ZIZPA|nr:hypothetical protein GUJ93_ZPchr0002g23059 [Zizania palustris]